MKKIEYKHFLKEENIHLPDYRIDDLFSKYEKKEFITDDILKEISRKYISKNGEKAWLNPKKCGEDGEFYPLYEFHFNVDKRSSLGGYPHANMERNEKARSWNSDGSRKEINVLSKTKYNKIRSPRFISNNLTKKENEESLTNKNKDGIIYEPIPPRKKVKIHPEVKDLCLNLNAKDNIARCAILNVPYGIEVCHIDDVQDNPSEANNPNNVLPFWAGIHDLFGGGNISFDDNGIIMYPANMLKNKLYKKYGLKIKSRIQFKLNKEQKKFLSTHRKKYGYE